MAWGSHIDGAVQLVKMRGKKYLRSKTGYSLFTTVRAQMVIFADIPDTVLNAEYLSDC